MDIWERGQDVGLVGDAKAEGYARYGRAASGREEKDDAVAWSYYNTVCYGKLQQAVRRATNREGGGCLLPDNQCTKTGQPVAEVLRKKHLDMHVPPCGKPHVRSF